MSSEKFATSRVDFVSTNSDGNGLQHSRQDWTVEEERIIKTKADRRVFPMLCILYSLSLLDRTNIAAANIAGLGRDLHLNVGSRYNLALLMFCLPYAIFELPSNLIIRRLGVRCWLSFLIISWGCIVLGVGFIDHWKSLVVLRTLLGMFEAGLLPGAVYVISSWYRQYESAKRMAIFICAGQLVQGFGPIFAYLLSLIRVGNGKFSHGWRWIFIAEGAITIAAGFLSPFFLTEFPEKAVFLTDRQRYIAAARVTLEKADTHTEHLSLSQSFRMALDWKVGIYSLQMFVAISSIYSLVNFQPLILLNGLGFPYALAQLLGAPPYVAAQLFALLISYLSDKYKTRWPMFIIQHVLVIVGLLVVLYAHPPGVRYFGLFLAAFGSQSNIPTVLIYGQNQTAKVQKRAVVAAMMTSAGAVGGVCGSLIFRSQDAPTYAPGMWSTIAMQALCLVVTFFTSMHLKRLNRLADAGKITALEGVEGFRYAP